MTDYHLSDGWVTVNLEAICEVNPAKPPADALPPKAPVSFVPMPAVDADSASITGAIERPFAEVRKGYTAFRDGDVILAKITPCFENGKAAEASNLRNGLGFGSSEFHVLRPTSALSARYLLHFLRQPSFREDAAAHMTGTAGQARVPTDYIRQVQIPIAPLPEQSRIVEKVQALLDQVNQARGRLAKVPLILKKFRQAVLASACSGKLTEDWREERQATGAQGSALTLLQSLQKADSKRTGGPKVRDDLAFHEIPDNWAWVDLRFLVSPKEAFCYGVVQPGDDDPDGVPLIRSGDLHNLPIALPNLRKIPKAVDVQFSRSRVSGGEILITVVGANIGTVAMAPAGAAGFNIARAVAKVPVREVSADFVILWLRSNIAFRWMVGDAREVARPTLNLEQLATLPVPLPPLDEQMEVVRRTEPLFALADIIERRVQTATATADKLPQAVLSKAFSGALVPTEAELARAEGRAFEPASVLLERIRGEQADKPAKNSKGQPGRKTEDVCASR